MQGAAGPAKMSFKWIWNIFSGQESEPNALTPTKRRPVIKTVRFKYNGARIEQAYLSAIFHTTNNTFGIFNLSRLCHRYGSIINASVKSPRFKMYRNIWIKDISVYHLSKRYIRRLAAGTISCLHIIMVTFSSWNLIYFYWKQGRAQRKIAVSWFKVKLTNFCTFFSLVFRHRLRCFSENDCLPAPGCTSWHLLVHCATNISYTYRN